MAIPTWTELIIFAVVIALVVLLIWHFPKFAAADFTISTRGMPRFLAGPIQRTSRGNTCSHIWTVRG